MTLFSYDCEKTLAMCIEVVHPQHRGGRGESEPILLFGEVDRWKATDHCSPEIHCDSVHLGHPPVPAPLSSANR